MKSSTKLKRLFNSIHKCYQPLLKFEIDNCIKCGNCEFYIIIENYEKTCKKCKTRCKTTYSTIFHNIRFGLLKAFHLYIDILFEEPQPNSSELAKRYNLTFKTTNRFKQKVINENDFLNLESYLEKNKLSKEEKLFSYIKKINN